MSKSKATSTHTATAEKSTETTDTHERADHASDAFMVGIDNNGREHWYSRIRGTMTVLDDGEDETQPLDGRPLKVWMAFVDQELCGWKETNVYSGSTVDHLTHHLDAATEEAR